MSYWSPASGVCEEVVFFFAAESNDSQKVQEDFTWISRRFISMEPGRAFPGECEGAFHFSGKCEWPGSFLERLIAF